MLDFEWLNTSLRRYYHLDRPSNTHLEASLVKVVGILVQDVILGFDVAYKVELGADNSWITAQDSLVIALSGHLRLDLRFWRTRFLAHFPPTWPP